MFKQVTLTFEMIISFGKALYPIKQILSDTLINANMGQSTLIYIAL